MCDTLVIIRDGCTWFAKNSDREPDEPQVMDVHPPVRHDPAPTLTTTYIEIPQVPDRFGVILSRPIWMWGAEMGVNDQGVAIGNEAVFSKLVDRKGKALLGMDLVRLGLERAGSADDALEVITNLLETHGQGGPAGYKDKSFSYDNSFLIADGNGAWVLETAGRQWVAKRISDYWAISNCYTLGRAYDQSSGVAPGEDFKKAVETKIRPWLARGRDRIRVSNTRIKNAAGTPVSLSLLASILRAHNKGDGFGGGSNRDICMHAGGLLRPSQTTGSMVVKLEAGELPRVALTGTPGPCVSLFKPARFMEDPELWSKGDAIFRAAKRDPEFRQRVRAGIEAEEPAILRAIEQGSDDDMRLAGQTALQWLESMSSAQAMS